MKNINIQINKEEIYNKIKDVEYQFKINENDRVTEYKFQVNNKLDTKQHNKVNSDLLKFMIVNQFKSFSFITAQNPNYNILINTELSNIKSNENLKNDLNEYKFFEAETIFDNKFDEIGFIVFDLPIHLLLILKNKYTQNAVVFGNNKYIKLII